MLLLGVGSSSENKDGEEEVEDVVEVEVEVVVVVGRMFDHRVRKNLSEVYYTNSARSYVRRADFLQMDASISTTLFNFTATMESTAALIQQAEVYRDQKSVFDRHRTNRLTSLIVCRNAQGLAEVITLSRAFMSSTAKAKTAKLIRTLLDYFNSIPDSKQTQINVLVDNIDWAKREKRIFLKHSLETRLVGL